MPKCTMHRMYERRTQRMRFIHSFRTQRARFMACSARVNSCMRNVYLSCIDGTRAHNATRQEWEFICCCSRTARQRTMVETTRRGCANWKVNRRGRRSTRIALRMLQNQHRSDAFIDRHAFAFIYSSRDKLKKKWKIQFSVDYPPFRRDWVQMNDFHQHNRQS